MTIAVNLFTEQREQGAVVLRRRRVSHLAGAGRETPPPDVLPMLARAAHWMPELILITDGDGRVQYVNPAFEAATGYAAAALVGRPAAILNSGAHDAQFFRSMWQTIHAGGVFRAVFTNRRQNGTIYYEDKTITPIRDGKGNVIHFLSSGRDVTSWLERLERLEYRATHDSLTGLPNRALVMDRLRQEIARARRRKDGFALAYVDVDRFKEINDTLGHAAGDRVLQAVGRLFQLNMRGEDTAGRIAGDEFVLVLAGAGRPDQAAKVLDNVVAALRHGVWGEERAIAVTVSIGLCLYPIDGEDEKTLLKRADTALYRAKRDGGNCWRYFGGEP